MTNIAVLAVCMLAGLILRLTGRAPVDAHVSLNVFIIHVALPAMILRQIHGLPLAPDLLFPISMPWLLFGLSVPVFTLLGRAVIFPNSVVGALIMTAGLANTSFVGLPMIETFYGKQDLPTGILIDQLGSYLVLATAGIAVASFYSTGVTSWRVMGKKIVTFPPFIALVLALALSAVKYPSWLDGLFLRLGDTLAPLALVSVGLQLRLDQLKGYRFALVTGLGFKLIVAPMLLALLYFGLLSWRGEIPRVTIFEAAMGPMIGGAIVAMQYGLSQPVVTLMVGVGIALSFVTLPLWYLGLALI